MEEGAGAAAGRGGENPVIVSSSLNGQRCIRRSIRQMPEKTKRSARTSGRNAAYSHMSRSGRCLGGRLLTIFLIIAFNPTGRVNELLPSGEERVTVRADFQLEISDG
jgi:hypothetical protein